MLNEFMLCRWDRNLRAWMLQDVTCWHSSSSQGATFSKNLIYDRLPVAVDDFLMMTSLHSAYFPAAVTLFLYSSPARFSCYWCGGYDDASVPRRSLLLCVAAISVVGPAAVLLSVLSLLWTTVNMQPTNFGEYYEMGVYALPQIEL